VTYDFGEVDAGGGDEIGRAIWSAIIEIWWGWVGEPGEMDKQFQHGDHREGHREERKMCGAGS